MNYPAIFTRNTGIQTVSLAMSGQCKMQDAATNALMHAPDIDAFLFDTFSNPHAPEIEARLFQFIEKIQSAHPGKPLIFQQTIIASTAISTKRKQPASSKKWKQRHG